MNLSMAWLDKKEGRSKSNACLKNEKHKCENGNRSEACLKDQEYNCERSSKASDAEVSPGIRPHG